MPRSGAGWTLADAPRLDDKTAIVTGANSGLGLETARGFARLGATVVLACRNLDAAKTASDDIAGTVADARLEIVHLDLSDLESVREAADLIRDNHRKIDILVNNAGVMSRERQLTADGFELDFGTNFLGHYALTGRLLDRINTSVGRIVTVTSAVHRKGSIDFDDLPMERGYSVPAAYARSKLAELMFAIELQRRLAADGMAGASLASHPGASYSGVMREQNKILNWAFTSPNMRWLLDRFVQEPDQGALPTLRAATDPAAFGGQFYGPSGRLEATGSPVLVSPADRAVDPVAAQKLWDVAEELTGVEYSFD
ncbi:MAG: SDR family NAD(P)-dependent oxidoreductase [Gordonia sp.]|uniref:oxidoreductase n=1 Tax=Gordonia sp. (in: high G+C Gram-positive bacteria) TaxID=84139 RepID=UPI001D97CD11|nr:oxidoreductase [Gordonia sp. (in: high G+C Gram-positive bacteria)]MCB1294409.1 SDR family NAD(P)-dependent oxidoreductase [Gordonia sp. (in: high G+C Gram-positive bacteria)]